METYYTDCDCLADHWREFKSLEAAKADFDKRDKCFNKILYKINEEGKLIEIEQKSKAFE